MKMKRYSDFLVRESSSLEDPIWIVVSAMDGLSVERVEMPDGFPFWVFELSDVPTKGQMEQVSAHLLGEGYSWARGKNYLAVGDRSMTGQPISNPFVSKLLSNWGKGRIESVVKQRADGRIYFRGEYDLKIGDYLVANILLNDMARTYEIRVSKELFAFLTSVHADKHAILDSVNKWTGREIGPSRYGKERVEDSNVQVFELGTERYYR
jgi:hypothetical protein